MPKENQSKMKIKKNHTSTLENNYDTESGRIAIREKVII